MQNVLVGVTSGTGGSADNIMAYSLFYLAGNYSYTFTPTSTVTRRPSFRFIVNGIYDFTISNFSIKEVGVSSTGFTTAQNEPVIPQIPLVKSNEIAIFDGVDDYVSLGGDISLTNDFTIEIWASTLNSGSNDFLGHASDISFIRTDTGNNRLRIRNTSGSIANLTSLTTPTDGSIFHLVLSRNSGVITAYLNGVKTGNTPTIYGTLNINEIGNVSGNTEYDGLIFSVSIFNSAFTETSIS